MSKVKKPKPEEKARTASEWAKLVSEVTTAVLNGEIEPNTAKIVISGARASVALKTESREIHKGCGEPYNREILDFGGVHSVPEESLHQ